jgi:tripartite-type tricarboxylate transporter receptor subunit TctC
MKKLFSAIALAAIAIGNGRAGAESYPTRPVTIVAPFPAGGPSDALARILSEPLRAALGQPVVIENVVGAGGNIGIGRVARASPDGYTLAVGQWGTHVVNPVTYSLSYDVVNDFEPIALLANTSQLIIGRKDFPAKDVHGLSGSRPIPTRPWPVRLGPPVARRSPQSISSRPLGPGSGLCLIAAARR